MKNLLFIFLLLSPVAFSQSEFNMEQFVSLFGTHVNENISMLKKSDVKLIQQSTISSDIPFEEQWIEMENIPVSEDFWENPTPKIEALMNELNEICQPLWDKSFSSDEESYNTYHQIHLEFGKLKNGKVVQYLFTQVIFLRAMDVMILGEPDL